MVRVAVFVLFSAATCEPMVTSQSNLRYMVLFTVPGCDMFLARPTSRCVLFDGENISFDASLLYI